MILVTFVLSYGNMFYYEVLITSEKKIIEKLFCFVVQLFLVVGNVWPHLINKLNLESMKCIAKVIIFNKLLLTTIA